MHRYLCLLLALCVAPAFSRKRLSAKDLSSDEVQSFEIDDDDEHAPVLERTSFVLDDYRKLTIELSAERLCGQALVDYVNWRQDLWTARLSGKFESYSEGAKWGLMGVNNIANSITGRKHESRTRYLDIRLPKNFDSRTNWPQCNSIKQIRDQSSCGSCWAFGAVEAMSDRICIATNGKIQTSLSADDLLSCCSACGFGCNGGDPLAAWRYWVKDGIVTGSNYTLKQGCKPYPFPSCEHHSNKTHFPACKHDLYPTPRCEKTCQDGYTKEYKLDKFYGKTAYSVHPSVEAIQKEVFTHGPVEVAFEVYEDFLHYESGIYVHQGGKLGGGHAVKLIGWGEESGIPYWIVANSWNSDWGENGFFRILRGVDECGIESGVVGGVPKIDRYNFDNDDDDLF